MSDANEGIAHSELSTSKLDPADVRDAGDGSRIFHESSMDEMDSAHDGRSKHLLINGQVVPDAGDILVDVVEYGPEVSCPLHYHEGTTHFFYILDGEGVLEVDGEEIDLERGSVAWIGEGDPHRLYAREGEGMTVLEYFSNGDHETEWVEGQECTWQPTG